MHPLQVMTAGAHSAPAQTYSAQTQTPTRWDRNIVPEFAFNEMPCEARWLTTASRLDLVRNALFTANDLRRSFDDEDTIEFDKSVRYLEALTITLSTLTKAGN